MTTVVLIIHIFICIGLVTVVLLQRSEGGALGIGGGGPGGLISSRGAANALTRMTGVLGASFFVTSIILTVLANTGGDQRSVFEDAPVETLERLAPPVEDDAPLVPGSN